LASLASAATYPFAAAAQFARPTIGLLSGADEVIE
jgi:hypothetical protein